MRFIFYIVGFFTTVSGVLLINEVFFAGKKQVRGRLGMIQETGSMTEEERALRRPFSERVIEPLYQRLLEWINSVTPKGIQDQYERIIIEAGSPKDLTISRIVFVQTLFAIVLMAMFYLLMSGGGEVNALYIVVIGVIGFILPYRMVVSKADQRKEEITRALPNFLDLLYVSVEAGLSFDMALNRTLDKTEGPLSDEFRKALEEIRLGKSRPEAFRGIVKRTGVPDLSSFITSVIQSEQLGSDIAGMLRTQSSTMRQKRSQRAEEAARKIPIKMLFPLIFFIFPTLFIVVLGPAMINIMETLGGM